MTLSLKNAHYFFFFLPQSPDKMLGLSKDKHNKGQRTLSREELEINEILSSPTSGSQNSEKINPAQPSKTSKEVPPTKVLSMEDLSSLITESVVRGVQAVANAPNSILGKRTAHQREFSNKISFPMSQADSDLPGVDTVRKGTAPPVEVFGSDINENSSESSDEEDQEQELGSTVPRNRNPSPLENIPAQSSGDSFIKSKKETSSPDKEEKPDVDLPSGNSRLPASWYPKSKVLAWLEKIADNEWTAEDRKKILDQFHPLEKFDQLLSPVKMPKKLYKSVNSVHTKKKDYLFNRGAAEKELFNASSDLCASLRPLIEAISQLDDIPGSASVKNLIGNGVLGIVSANLRVSRGRREISRRCVRLDLAEALFSNSPNHKSLFGGNSNMEAIKAAKEAAKVDDSFVFKPAKIKKFHYLSQPPRSVQRKNSVFSQSLLRLQPIQVIRSETVTDKGKGQRKRSKGQRSKENLQADLFQGLDPKVQQHVSHSSLITGQKCVQIITF